ncbi:MAG: YeeE/YedE family protein [bacterium]|nr:YeeE/YedE family protein [bacterium]
MMAPLYKYGLFGDEASLVVAFLIGIGFGFFLERAGFGSARKLMGQFYLTDMAVFKVMFTAVVTAMLGLFYLGWIGVLDLSLVYLSETWLLPQAVGGLLLGFGFIIGGYCPGTSMVAIATGKIDALLFAAGVFVGIVGFGEAWPLISGFAASTALGTQTLPGALFLPYGVLVFVIVLIALVAFRGAEWVEARAAEKAS